LTDAAWWTANCKGNSNIACDVATNPAMQYVSATGPRVCYPSEDSTHANNERVLDNVDIFKEEMM
jgi:hypothetical protein